MSADTNRGISSSLGWPKKENQDGSSSFDKRVISFTRYWSSHLRLSTRSPTKKESLPDGPPHWQVRRRPQEENQYIAEFYIAHFGIQKTTEVRWDDKQNCLVYIHLLCEYQVFFNNNGHTIYERYADNVPIPQLKNAHVVIIG